MEFVKYEKDPVNGRWYAVKEKPIAIAQEINYAEFMKRQKIAKVLQMVGDGIAAFLLFALFYMALIIF